MHSRRTILSAVGTGVVAATAGCTASVLGGDTRNSDGLTHDEDLSRGGGYLQRYDVNLAEGEYDYTTFEISGDRPIALSARVYSGNLHGMLLEEREFDNAYRDSDSLRGYYVMADENTESDRESMRSGDSSHWVMVADNTDYLDHEPDGGCEAQLTLVIN